MTATDLWTQLAAQSFPFPAWAYFVGGACLLVILVVATPAVIATLRANDLMRRAGDPDEEARRAQDHANRLTWVALLAGLVLVVTGGLTMGAAADHAASQRSSLVAQYLYDKDDLVVTSMITGYATAVGAGVTADGDAVDVTVDWLPFSQIPDDVAALPAAFDPLTVTITKTTTQTGTGASAMALWETLNAPHDGVPRDEAVKQWLLDEHDLTILGDVDLTYVHDSFFDRMLAVLQSPPPAGATASAYDTTGARHDVTVTWLPLGTEPLLPDVELPAAAKPVTVTITPATP